MQKSENPFYLIMLTSFFSALLVSTLGRFPGALAPLSALCGFFLIFYTIRAYWAFGQIVRSELGKRFLLIGAVTLFVQLFWAFFRAPLDVDGIFYHLTIILEALSKNQWGSWNFGIWQIQNTPKLGEIPNLLMIAFGNLLGIGYRFAQFGHFSTGLIGAWSLMILARECHLKKPVLFGIAFLFTPIVVKQMSSNYVDAAVASYWLLVAATLVLALKQKTPSLSKWVPTGMAVFLLSGVKMHGIVLLASFLPLLAYALQRRWNRPATLWGGVGVIIFFALAASSTWMLSNAIRFDNPVFPLRPDGILPWVKHGVLPGRIPVYILIGPASQLPFPLPIQWLFQFFLFEPFAQYDSNSGAWGFLGLWGFIVTAFGLMSGKFPLPRWKTASLPFVLLVCLFCSFALTQGRFTPRYGLLGGFLFILPALFLYVQGKLGKQAHFWLMVALCIQVPYVLGERVLFKGVKENPTQLFSIIAENFRDILIDGEPQTPGRWMHREYVPSLRKQEPRSVTIGKDCIDLPALYWGRTFSNQVTVTADCSTWPY